MDFELTDEERQVRELARRFAEDEIAPSVFENEKAMRFPRELIAKMGELGFFGAAFPRKYGGTGMGYLCHALICEEVSRVHSSLRTPFNMQAMTCAGTLGMAQACLAVSVEHANQHVQYHAPADRLGRLGH